MSKMKTVSKRNMFQQQVNAKPRYTFSQTNMFVLEHCAMESGSFEQ